MEQSDCFTLVVGPLNAYSCNKALKEYLYIVNRSRSRIKISLERNPSLLFHLTERLNLLLGVYISQGKFKSAPTVLVSAEHEKRGVKHDASSVWVEDATTTSFKICIRELQNFDGAHQSIHIVSSLQLFMVNSVIWSDLYGCNEEYIQFCEGRVMKRLKVFQSSRSAQSH